ncbi:MAG TPA: protein kinase [Terriglobales bacterium]|jgi:serine/threonine protein kinase
MPLPPGTQLGDCEILSLLGAGGMGEVYRALDRSLGREVAIKVLPHEFASDPERLRRFEQEARAAAALNHPHILTVYRFGLGDGDTPFIVTELLQGQTVRERLEQGALTVRKATEYALQAARGLAAAHERGIVHRDLKPENLFITRDGVTKILDFGLAKIVAGETFPDNAPTIGGTQAGLVLGTVGYMSPEQVRAQPVDNRSDIFSLGAILYEMLSGRRAFQGETLADTMSAILREEPPELSSTVHNLPPSLGHIVHRCMEKDSAQRFQSARDLAFSLELITRQESGTLPSIPVSQGKRFRNVALIAAIVILALTSIGLSSLLWTRSRPRTYLPVQLRRLTDFVGVEEFPAFSPDGNSVAFVSEDREGRRQIWVSLLAGGSPLQITHDDADHQSPRWSPDSSSLIYFSPSGKPEDPGQIWEIPALGGTARPIASSFEAGDVSHDGKSIAYFHGENGKVMLALANRDGSNPRTMAELSADLTYSDLHWSPDDRMVGYQAGRVFNYDVYYVAVSGGQAQKITRDGNPLAGFAWLPDSSGVVYSTSRGSTVLYLPTMNLWSVDLGGENLRQLTFGETSYISPDVDRKGTIVSTRMQTQFDIWRFPTGDNPAENVARGLRVTQQTGAVQTPSAGPNDKEIAYLSDTGGHGNIWIIDLQTHKSRQITFEQDPRVGIGVPVFSPDGTRIAYVTRSPAGWNVDQWLVDPDGTNPQRVSVGGGWAAWSPDSRWLYLAEPTPDGQFNIKKVSADGHTILPVRDSGQRPAIAADGTLYYSVESANVKGTSDLEIRKAKPENADSTALVRIPGSRIPPWMMVQPVLSPDGKWLAMTLADGYTSNVWAQPTDGGPMRRITDFGYQATLITRRVSWSSDGKSIFAAVGKSEADIVLLSNLIR